MYVKKQWEVDDICEISNPSSGSTTCFAEAVTRRRRCRRVVVSARQVSAMLERLTTLSPLEAAKSNKLREAAQMSVCWQHTAQAEDIAQRWKQALVALDNQPAADTHSWGRRAGTVKVEEEWDNGYFSFKDAKPQQSRVFEPDMRAMMEEMQRLREAIKQLKKENTENESRYSQPRAKEQQRQQRDDEEARRRKEEEEEHRRREERKQKEREERERREREERERREREEAERQKRQRDEEERRRREEDLRTRARRRAQEREEAAKQEWVAAWSLYGQRWEAVARINPTKVRKPSTLLLYHRGAQEERGTNKGELQIKSHEIPWPVKTARWEDVSEANVKEFYRKAPLVAREATTGEEIYRLMGQENKRWHTDKIMQQFGTRILDGLYGTALNTVAKALVDLRREAQDKRRQ